MLILDTTSALLRVTTSAAGDIQCSVSYVDDIVETAGPPRVDVFQPEWQPTAAITTATTTTILAGSATASTRRNVKLLTIRNAHATVANTITVDETDGTTAVKFPTFTLSAGEYATINDAGTFFAYDANGAVKAGTGPGRLLRTTVLTAGTSITTSSLTTLIFVRGKAGGGGGGGCTAVASQSGAAGGGAEGGYFEKLWTVAPSTAYSYTIGAAGTGVSGAGGNAGGNTTFVVGGTTATAFGGPGAIVATASASLTARAGAASPAVSTNGDVNQGGQPGEHGVILIVAGPIGCSGKGGGTGGGVGTTTAGNGTAAIGFGNGGGGAITVTTVRTGGSGTAGMIIVDEYS